jgi:hypothetical protein
MTTRCAAFIASLEESGKPLSREIFNYPINSKDSMAYKTPMNG